MAMAIVDAVSDSYDSKEVVLNWWDDEPIEIHTGKLQLPQFTMTNRTPSTCVEAYKTGSLINLMCSSEPVKLFRSYTLRKKY